MCIEEISSSPLWQVDSTSGQKQLAIFTIHGRKYCMIKSSLRPVLTIQWKIFLSNQVNFSDWSKMFSAEIEYGTHFSSHSCMLVQFICKPSKPVQWYFSHLQSKINENQPLDWLRDMNYGWATKSASSKTNKQKISTAQLGSEHDNTMNEKRQPSTG